MEKTFLIIGGDKRLEYLYNLLVSKNKKVEHILFKDSKNDFYNTQKIKNYDVIILPVPISADNVTLFAPYLTQKVSLENIFDNITEKQIVFGGGSHKLLQNINYYNLLDDEVMTLKNAMATAEAALSIIISEYNKTIFGSKIYVLGFGRIGKILAKYLKNMNGEVIICARRDEVIENARISGFKTCTFGLLATELDSADIIINTVPHLVITEKELKNIKKSSFIIDLASKPGGVDFLWAEKLGIKTIHALSLPGKFSPLSSAEYIEQSVLNTLEKLRGEAYEK